jgi:peptide/nickel transport system ATP-binding protein
MTMGLQVRDLNVTYRIQDEAIRAVDSVSFDVAQGERLGIVGESGSGKTTTALALMQMLRAPGRCESGTAVVDGIDLLALPPARMREHRLRTISYIPQGAMNSLNPVHTVEHQMRSAMLDHGVASSRTELLRLCVTALAGVGLGADVLRRYPHELSGGMKQRVCVAIGMLLGPKIIIADEPTSALDVISQRLVMETLGREQQRSKAALLLIGHDIGLMAQFVDRLAVMYAGRLVEIGSIREVLTRPRHPYTRALIASIPRLRDRGILGGIPGVTPSLRQLPRGCAFHPRCAARFERCLHDKPLLDADPGGHHTACHLRDAA